MNKKTFLLLAAIFLIGAFFRFFDLSRVPPGLYPDEAMNGNNALEALETGHFKAFYPENNGREGLFINMQAMSLKFFGNTPWALRVVSAFFGTLTVLALYFLTRELFPAGVWPALFSSFFLATSYWHLNFSRVGFRAIMLPLFSVLSLYFLLKGLRERKICQIISAGIFIGLGLQTYIGFRFVPLVLAIPIIYYFYLWLKKQNPGFGWRILVFLVVTFVVALPIGAYFFQNQQDFIGRSGQVSIFADKNPFWGFVKSNVLTLGMLFARGDCNWRHNYNCQPELNPIVGIFFLIGLGVMIYGLFKSEAPASPAGRRSTKSLPGRQAGEINPKSQIPNPKLAFWTLAACLFFMSLPATLTREGLPHALRSIGLIPPIMILAGIGAWFLVNAIFEWLKKQVQKRPSSASQLNRIRKELLGLLILVLLALPIWTYRDYFVRWASHKTTYDEFDTSSWNLGVFLSKLPTETKKFVIVNRDTGVKIRGIPMPAQNVMFATNTFTEKGRVEKNFVYLLPNEIEKISLTAGQKAVISFLKPEDKDLILSVQKKFPELQIKVPGDFAVLTRP